MKEMKRFLRRHKSKILSGITIFLMLAAIGMAILYVLTEAISPSIIFFVGAVLMIDLAVNYSLQHKKGKGVYAFYALAAAGCIAIGCILQFVPM